MVRRWEKAVEKATKQNGNLKEALEKSRKVLYFLIVHFFGLETLIAYPC